MKCASHGIIFVQTFHPLTTLSQLSKSDALDPTVPSGGYDLEEHAAEAYDVAALKTKKNGNLKTNFDVERYQELFGCMHTISLEGHSRGSSSFRGVTSHPSGRWESRIGVPGSKHVYLGLFEEEVEAARAYDRSLVRLRGSNAATNFALNDYVKETEEHYQAL
ncbi:hypothetical protein DUNSADRAFT_16617, partial [Dunaliella salina]